ncbi:hypothetical protein [Cellulomonas soli]
MPIAPSIVRHPPYSRPAASEIVVILSKWRTVARWSAKKSGTPSSLVSPDVIGMQSKPMTPVRVGVWRASASSRWLRRRSATSSGST